jgi:hypothetical protein
MEEQGLILEEATFRFSQDSHCLDGNNDYEFKYYNSLNFYTIVCFLKARSEFKIKRNTVIS